MEGSETKRVIILGAGASAASDFCLPTMKGFFEDDLSHHLELDKFLKWFYGDCERSEYNLEEILGYLDLAHSQLPQWTQEDRPLYGGKKVGYPELLSYVLQRLSTPREERCSVHRNLFSSLNDQDTIITLNYDLIADLVLQDLEKAPETGLVSSDLRLAELGAILSGKPDLFWNSSATPLSLTPREWKWGFYLKLHGSLNWLHCVHPGCPNSLIIFPAWPDDHGNWQSAGDSCRLCGWQIQVLIVPPIGTKRVDETGRIAFLWNLALQELRKANEIAIIGVSFAPSDLALRWLIRQAMELRRGKKGLTLSVVNPSLTDREETLKCFPGGGNQTKEFGEVSAFIEALKTNGM